MIYFSTSIRAACISLVNYLAQESDWLAVPLDADGSLMVVFVRKSCTRGTGYRKAADLFDAEGCASKTAEVIRQVANHRGASASDAETTGCRRLLEAVEEAEYN